VSKVEVVKEVINLAQLKYVNITIDGMNQCVRALADGGAEPSVINAKLLHDIEYVSLGKVCLRGIIGNPVSAEIANVRIRLFMSDDEFVSTTFAVCSDVNEDCILTDDVVNRLYEKHNIKLSATNVSQPVDNDVNYVSNVKSDHITNNDVDNNSCDRVDFSKR